MQVLEQLRLVNFTTQNGNKVSFDANGDSVAQYDLVNWQIGEDGSANIVNIGRYDGSKPDGQKFLIKDNFKIVWGGNHAEVQQCDCNDCKQQLWQLCTLNRQLNSSITGRKTAWSQDII